MNARPILFLAESRGVYIPRDFANEIRRDCLSGVDDETLAILRTGPSHEWYWEAWGDLKRDASITDPDTGIVYRVYQDGDCWLIPEGMTANDCGEFVAEVEQ